MIMIYQSFMIHREEQITLAGKALRMTFETVNSLFGNREIKYISTSGKKGKTLRLEVRFENTMFTCMFNQDNICSMVFLFFDNQNDIGHYIEYCKQSYKYDAESYSWINNDCYIWLYNEDNITNLVFSTLNPIDS